MATTDTVMLIRSVLRAARRRRARAVAQDGADAVLATQGPCSVTWGGTLLSNVVPSFPCDITSGVAVRSFGELEAAIMDYLWSQDGPRTVREMHTALSSGRSSAHG
jgi:hypothetical protein